MLLQVGLSIFKILLQITRPKTMMLGNIPGTNIYRDLHQYKEAVAVPGFLILAIEAPINFANTTYLKERCSVLSFLIMASRSYKTIQNVSSQAHSPLFKFRIMRWIQDYYDAENEDSKNKSHLKFLILDLSGHSLTLFLC